MKLCVLGSGSKGNSVYVEAGGVKVLFDAGFSALQLKKRLAQVGASINELDAIFTSHEHSDHVAGLRVLGKKLPLFATAGTLAEVRLRFELNGTEIIEPGEWGRLGGLDFLPVPVSHDAAEPVGFILSDGKIKVAVMTDLGVVTRVIEHHMKDLTAAVIECNHDPIMLRDGPYPWELKQRIKGRMGHLANPESAELAASICRGGLKRLYLAHLSEENNRPELAMEAVAKAVDGAGVALSVCAQDRPCPMIEL